MAAQVIETDFGTKEATRRKMVEMRDSTPTQFEIMMDKYWFKVYQNAVESITEMGAVDTGSLRQSIRIEKNKTIDPEFSTHSEIARTDAEFNGYIVAGGGGVINRKHNREVDYAQEVHDGYFTSKHAKIEFKNISKLRKSKGFKKLSPSQLSNPNRLGGGFAGWKAGRPFLDDAIQKTEAYLEELIKDYMDGKELKWTEGQPLGSSFSLPQQMF
jgi:hypothetical protein